MSEVQRIDDSHARFNLNVWRPILSRARASPRPIVGLIAGGIIVIEEEVSA